MSDSEDVTDLSQVKDEDQVHVQLRIQQEDTENQTEGAVHLNFLTNLWRFVQESDDGENAMEGFAYKDVQSLPTAIEDKLTEDMTEWMGQGGNVYLAVPVEAIAEDSPYVDRVEHRFRNQDRISFLNREEEALQEETEDGTPDQEERVCEECGNSYTEGTEKRCRSCRQDIEDQEDEEE